MKLQLTQTNVAIFFFSIFFWFYIAKVGFMNSATILAAIWGCYFTFRNSREVWRYFIETKFWIFFLLIWVPIVISAFDSLAPQDSWRSVLNVMRFFFIGALALLLTMPALNKIRYAVLGFIVLVSLDAVVEWLTGYHLLGESRDRVRIMGLFRLYAMGYVLATLTPLIFYQTLSCFINKGRWRYVWLVISFCTIITIFVAGSRAGLVSLVVSLGLLFLWAVIHKKISLRIVSIAILLIFAVSIGISQVPMVKERIVNPYGAASVKIGSYDWFDKMSTFRLVLWEYAWKQYQRYPVIGAGTRSFHGQFSAQPKELKGVHDEAYFPHFHGLEVLSETGTVGFIGYLITLFWLLGVIIKSKQFPVWLTVSFIAMMPINMHVAFYESFWAILIWIPLILGLREKYLLMHCDPLKKY